METTVQRLGHARGCPERLAAGPAYGGPCSGLLLDVSHSELGTSCPGDQHPAGPAPPRLRTTKTARVGAFRIHDHGRFARLVPERAPRDHHTWLPPPPHEQPNVARVAEPFASTTGPLRPTRSRIPRRVQECIPARRRADRACGYVNLSQRKWDVVQPVEPRLDTRGPPEMCLDDETHTKEQVALHSPAAPNLSGSAVPIGVVDRRAGTPPAEER